MYKQVIQTFTKQFIYVLPLRKDIHLATETLPYPKPDNEYPIKTKEKILKNEPFEPAQKETKIFDCYYGDKILKIKEKNGKNPIAKYNLDGILVGTYEDVNHAIGGEYLMGGIYHSLKTAKKYKDFYFRHYYGSEPPLTIEVDYICLIDGITFATYASAARYIGTSKQCVHQAAARKSKKIKGKEVIWKT